MPVLPRLAELRAIEDPQQRRLTTREVHAILLQSWKADRRWGGMAEHLVEQIHPMFRHGFARLAAQAEASKRVNVSSFRGLVHSLHHHHTIEDRAWFPQLKRLHPDARPEIDILETDHRKLVELEAQVSSGDYDAHVEFIDHLMDHLNREEMLSVPWLLDGTGAL
ncbi:Aste57867_16279 [Aphanomyces stellatus]|uniref:Aste57867_16279 protein n=1 Tax=Aphanomyces stellatus TaxID=120398 RepID=A0A485L6F4_9STRA|nr:hypothetical protein As57867_016222 [Aphanomyces stellatus]VFT93055.1 Aste57867_16279 [Aphanomyces stellatus]